MSRSIFKTSLLIITVGFLIAGQSFLVTEGHAAYTIDRMYRMGDDGAEGASNGSDVGSGNAFGTTFDGDNGGGAAAFEDLVPTGAPTYVEYGVGGNPVAPIAGAGNSFGIQFDGVDDYLSAVNLNDPSIAAPGATPTYATTNRGMQFWAYPTNVDGTIEHLVDDADEHKIRINTGGSWNPGVRENVIGSGLAVQQDAWTHLMLVHDSFNTGAVVSYVNGLVATTHVVGYTGANVNDLIVGANSEDNVGTTADPNTLTNPGFYSGIIDELELFVLDNDEADTFGTFDYTTDNGYFTDVFLPSQSGYGFTLDAGTGHNSETWVQGDIDFDGVFGQGDVDAFVAGWLSDAPVTPGTTFPTGDYSTLLNGDLDLDGDTDLADWILLRQYSQAAPATVSFASFAQFAAVPEPTSALLVITGMLSISMLRRPIETKI